MSDLKITLVQSEIFWEEPAQNLVHWEEKIADVSTDIIVLPEMFTTGFTSNTAVADMVGMRTTQWMKRMAHKTNALVLGSVMMHVHDKFFNRLLWVEPDGTVRTYDKRHVFSMAGEEEWCSPGESLLVATWRGWRICPLICYDLRFPVWSRNSWDEETQRMKYDVLLYVANWPSVRIDAWDVLLRARAIENLCYVVGVNRIGMDGNRIDYNGQSAVIDPRGNTIVSLRDADETKTLALNAHALQAYREKFPTYKQADKFSLDVEEYY